MKYLIVLLASVLALQLANNPFAHAARDQRIKVKEALRVELNTILRETNRLHRSCVKRNEEAIGTTIKELIRSIDQAEKKSVLAPDSQQALLKILKAAREDLKMVQQTSGKDRRQRIKEAFFQLVQIAQVYDLDEYRIFFCSKDKAVWLQKDWSPKNPVHPDIYPKCGKLVRSS